MYIFISEVSIMEKPQTEVTHCDNDTGQSMALSFETLMWSGLVKLRCEEQGPFYMKPMSFYVEVHLSTTSEGFELIYSQSYKSDVNLEANDGESDPDTKIDVSWEEVELVVYSIQNLRR